jgi:hypothetical protein
MEKVAQGHTTVEVEKEVVMMNLQLGGSSSSSGLYHSPEDELGHILLKRGARKGLDDCDSDYIPEQQ